MFNYALSLILIPCYIQNSHLALPYFDSFKEFLKRTPGHKPQPLQLASSTHTDRLPSQLNHQGTLNQAISAPAPQPRTSLLFSDR